MLLFTAFISNDLLRCAYVNYIYLNLLTSLVSFTHNCIAIQCSFFCTNQCVCMFVCIYSRPYFVFVYAETLKQFYYLQTCCRPIAVLKKFAASPKIWERFRMRSKTPPLPKLARRLEETQNMEINIFHNIANISSPQQNPSQWRWKTRSTMSTYGL